MSKELIQAQIEQYMGNTFPPTQSRHSNDLKGRGRQQLDPPKEITLQADEVDIQDSICNHDIDWVNKQYLKVNNMFAMKIDALDMEIEGLSDEDSQMLSVLLEEQEFKRKRVQLGEMRGECGSAVMFMMPFSFNNNTKIVMDVARLREQPTRLLDGTMIKVDIQSSRTYLYSRGAAYLVYEWQLLRDNKGVKVKLSGFDTKTRLEVPLDKSWNVQYEKEYTFKDLKFIPVFEFLNDHMGRPNLYNMYDIVKAQEKSLNMMLPEIFTSSTTLVFNKALMNVEADKIIYAKETGLKSVTIDRADAAFGEAITPVAPISKVPDMITLFDKYEDLIAKTAFLPTKSDDTGTHNKHNLETSMEQEQARDNLKAKKDIQQEQYSKFFRTMLLPMCILYNKISADIDLNAVKLIWEDAITEQTTQAALGMDDNQPTDGGESDGR